MGLTLVTGVMHEVTVLVNITPTTVLITVLTKSHDPPSRALGLGPGFTGFPEP